MNDLHASSVVIDAHCDILMDLTDGTAAWDRDDSAAVGPDAATCRGQYSLPQWERGGVTVQFCTIWTAAWGLDMRVSNPERGMGATTRALAMAGTLHAGLRRHADRMTLIRSAGDIDAAKASGRVGILLSMEGGEPLGLDVRLLDAFYALGLRSLGLTWSNRNFLADGIDAARQPGGITPLGLEVVERCNELGILLDTAHLHPVGVGELLEASRSPLIASHARMVGNRLLPEHARAIAAAGGVVCLIAYSWPTAAALLDHLDRLVDTCGEDHVGLGTDFYGRANAPVELHDIAALPRLTEMMLARGHRPERVAKVLGGNVRRLLAEVIG